MKISTTVSKVVSEDIELETPAFFKNDAGKSIAFYSEDHTVAVTALSDNYRTVTTCEFSTLYKPEDMISKGTRITEAEFNETLSEAIGVLTNSTGLLSTVRPVPELSIAS